MHTYLSLGMDATLFHTIFSAVVSAVGGLTVEVRHVTVNLLLLIYGSLDGWALKAGKPISSSARCWALYS